MDTAKRATELLGFLLGRDPTEAEAAEFGTPGFDCDIFLIRLLCSLEAMRLYGDLPQFFIDQLKREAAHDALPHKLAHELALAQDDLGQMQTRFDSLSGSMIDLLKQEDRIAGVFEVLRVMQQDFNTLRGRIVGIEDRLVVASGGDVGI